MSYMSSADQENDEQVENEKISPGDQILNHLTEIREMIAFLDFSFERAFTFKEKSYIRDYKQHVLQI